MALKKCPECGGKVSSAATACPACGHPLGKSFLEKQEAGCLRVIAFFTVVGIALWLLVPTHHDSNALPGSGSTGAPEAQSSPKPEHDKIGAWVMAKQFVVQRLKAPSTADFGSVFGDYQDPEACATYLGDAKYRCVGWVDAQNSFGAKLRNPFTVEVEYTGSGNWRCISCDLASN
jgi:hypothetical protein